MASRTICSDIVMSLQTGFCPLLNVWFNDMQTNTWLDLSTSLLGIPLRCNLFRKRIDQKNFLLWQQLTELCQLFDGLQNNFLLRIPQYSGKVLTREENKWQGNYKALCFTSKRNNHKEPEERKTFARKIKSFCIQFQCTNRQ